LKETAQEWAALPFGLVGKGKEYIVGTWEDEYKKTKGEEGVVKSVKALISTELKIGLDSYGVLKEYLSKGKQEASKKVE
jgi:hypothetical protein